MNPPRDEDMPSFEEVAWQMAIEGAVKMYQDLRSAGLGRRDAAAIIAEVMTTGKEENAD